MLNHPVDVDAGPDGRVYISDGRNGQVRFVDQARNIHANPGAGIGAAWKCEKQQNQGPSSPQTGFPFGLDVDRTGEVFFSIGKSGVRKVGKAGRVEPVPGAERIGFSTNLAVSPLGGIYVVDATGPRVVLINPGPRWVIAHGLRVPPKTASAVAGKGREIRSGNLNTEVSPQTPIAADNAGNFYFVDAEMKGVVTIDPSGEAAKLKFKSSKESAPCCSPAGLATDTKGNLYVGDAATGTVWFLNQGSEAITVHGVHVSPRHAEPVAGNGLSGFGGDGGPALDAQFKTVGALAADRRGNLFVADPEEHTVRRVDSKGIITTVLGTGGTSEWGLTEMDLIQN